MVAQYQDGGTDIQRYSFDAWGRKAVFRPMGQRPPDAAVAAGACKREPVRRNVNGSALGGALAMPGNLSAAQTQRGFTGHEMLDEVGLVHMNGRTQQMSTTR